MGELCEQDQHFLGREGAFVAFGKEQSLFVSLELGFHATTALVIGIEDS